MQNSKLFVRNLSFRTTDGELSDLFSQHGEVVSARIAKDRDTGRPRGFAFIEMNTPASAEEAIRALDNTEFGGRTMSVAMSEPRERRPVMAYGQ
jgi:RNA recognition motif-containing protein